jgi:hypothetical protein
MGLTNVAERDTYIAGMQIHGIVGRREGPWLQKRITIRSISLFNSEANAHSLMIHDDREEMMIDRGDHQHHDNRHHNIITRLSTWQGIFTLHYSTVGLG